MRSRAEVTFRARQELANLFLLVARPKFGGQAPGKLALPDGRQVAGALQGSEYARGVEALAERVLAHRLPVLGIELELGKDIQWRRDYLHGKDSGRAYFRRIPYLDFAQVGDHKIVWELSRHQQLVLLAEAFLFTGRAEYKDETFAQLQSWFEQNQFQRGINWASALEVAFRALSWIWVYHWLAPEMTEPFRRRFLTELYRHGRHLRENLSVYFSPNTHLQGEAVALHALGKFFGALPEAQDWVRRGGRIVREQLDFQVRPDGSHFEQSTYYHVYALDIFLFHYLAAGRPVEFVPVLERMAEYLFWLLGPDRRIAFLGDDDGGRLFHPYGARDGFGRATLATCGILFSRPEWRGTEQDVAEQAAWWIGAEALGFVNSSPAGARSARLFRDSGAAFLDSGDLHVQMDCGPFGWAGAGHSHSDTLSLVVSYRGERVFIDPGTYAYMGQPEERNWFRGSGAHNTVRIDGLDQGRGAGPFRWVSKPEVMLTRWEPAEEGGAIEANCRYEGFTHRRRVVLEAGRLLVWDEVEGPGEGEHSCEQIWQLGPGAHSVDLRFSAPAVRAAAKFSPAYGAQLASESLTVKVSGSLPLGIAMVLDSHGHGSVVTDPTCLQECAGAWGLRDERTVPR